MKEETQKNVAQAFAAATALLFLACLTYTVLHKSWNDFITVWPWIAVAYLAFTLRVLYGGKTINRELLTNPGQLARLLKSLDIVATFSIVTYCIGSATYDGIAYVSKTNFTYIIVLCIVVSGLFLWIFRHTFRSIYGMTEILAGIATGIYNIPITGTNNASMIFSVLGGIYLTVRGLDNIHQGIIKEPKDEAILWIKRRLNKQDNEAK